MKITFLSCFVVFLYTFPSPLHVYLPGTSTAQSDCFLIQDLHTPLAPLHNLPIHILACSRVLEIGQGFSLQMP